MLVDFDYFFAQCEEKRNPAIKDKPVVVGVYSGRSEDSGAVSTANYIARRYGVKSGIPIFLAKKKLENVDAVFLPVDHEFYDEVSGRIMEILKGYADSFEQIGVDEAYMDVSQRVNGDFGGARILALEIKNAVKTREGITCSIGIGPNKLVAKIASDFQKPDGLTVVKPEEIESFLALLPVDNLLGVGRKTVGKMQVLGIVTISDLAQYDIARLVEVFGKRMGTYFHEAAFGRDDTPVQERGEVESISRIATLKEDTRDLVHILETTDRLCEKVYARVAQRKVGFKSVSIMVVLVDMSVHSRTKTFEMPANDLEALRSAVKELFEKLLAECELMARRVGVKVAGFTEAERKQKSLVDFIN